MPSFVRSADYRWGQVGACVRKQANTREPSHEGYFGLCPLIRCYNNGVKKSFGVLIFSLSSSIIKVVMVVC